MTECPSAATLSRVLMESRECETFTEVEAHVECCASCRERLDRIRLNDEQVLGGDLPGRDAPPEIRGFEIIRFLGQGGMGIVYLARQKNVHRLVALKIVRSGPEAGSRERERWLREARAFSKVRHENVVTLLECGEWQGWLYLVLDFIPGGTVEETLKVPYSAGDAARLVEAVAKAVAAIHAAGLLHLDLKPSNIFLDGPDGQPRQRAQPRVGDLGIARHWSEAGASVGTASLGGPIGSPSHMAPEQVTAKRENLGPTTDVYGLGAVLYHVLTGNAPFLAPSTVETLDQVRNIDPVPPRRLNPKIPRDVETICLKCLEKEPGRRYQSAEAVAEDLRRFLDHEPIRARPTSFPVRGLRWCRRRPVITALTTTLLVTIMGSIVGLGLLLQRSERLRSQSETNFAIATQSLTDLVIHNRIILYNDSYHADKSTGFGQVRNTLRTSLSLEVELLRQNPRDCRGLQRLAFIYNDLAVFGSRDGDEAVSFNEKSVECWEAAVNLDPADSLDGYPTSERLLGQILLMQNLIDLKHDDLYDRWNSRAIAALQHMKSSPEGHAGRRYLLSRWHRVRADYLVSHNEPGRARRELQDDLDFLRSAPAAELEYPTFVLSEALTRAKLGRWSGESSLPRSPIRSAPGTVSIECVILDLDELATKRIGWLLSPDGLSPSNRQDLPAGAKMDRVLFAIRSDAAMFGLENHRIPKICWSMRLVYSTNLSVLRRIQHHDDANRVADCLLTLGENLTRAYPGQADSYMLLSDAYIQKAKNAYQKDAMVDAESFERLALDAAIKASRVEPGNGEARNLVEDRHTRVSRFASK